MKFRKRDLFANLINIAFFIITWLFLNSRLLNNGKIYSVEDFFSFNLINPEMAYTNLHQVVGVTFAILFILTSARVLNMKNPYELIKYNRDGFVKHKIKGIIINALIFVFEYLIIHVLFCIILCDFSVLLEVKFFPCIALFYISLTEYFLIIGISMLFLQYLLKFSNAYIALTAIVFCLLAIASNDLGIRISPVYFSDFIQDFAQSGGFNWFEYAVNLIETIIVFFILAISSRLIFLKRDIIINEKTDS